MEKVNSCPALVAVVLLAESDALITKDIALILKKNFCEVDSAENTETVWEKYEANHYDLIIINTILSGESTLQITRKIRRAEEALNGKMTPLVGICSDIERPKKYPYRKYYCAGMNDVYPQPLTHQHINEIMEKYLL